MAEANDEIAERLPQSLTGIQFRLMTGPINLAPAYMQMVADMCKEWGYDLEMERIERVTLAAVGYRMQGAALNVAISLALDDELVEYGERRPDATPIVGVTRRP